MLAYIALDGFGDGYGLFDQALQLNRFFFQPEQVFDGRAVVEAGMHFLYDLIVVHADLAALADHPGHDRTTVDQARRGQRHDAECSPENPGADKAGFVRATRLFVHGEEPRVFLVGQPDIIDICPGGFGGFATALFCIHHSTVLKI